MAAAGEPPLPDPKDVAAVIDAALAEDVGLGDITTRAVIPKGARLKADVVAREEIVIAGLPIALEVFRRLAPDATIAVKLAEGSIAMAGATIARVEGPAEGLLTAERTALNILQLLSGIATLTRKYVERVKGTKAVVLDTRKTIPGLRNLSKYATRVGGATNHRMRLDDGVLIKDNHVAVAGSVGEAVKRAKAAGLKNVEVECDTLDQVEEALGAGADRILLDNMTPERLREAVRMVNGRVPLEASGGVKLATIRAIAESGVDFISSGALTQGATAADIGLDYVFTTS
ncbi:MAG: carboxylating nicotinate-nucleotide diphosphorylase [Rhodospirillales bacterium]|nr:carboxylating nicotinate-nucleotide diphosphorylase [Rhodospirillales bacterium]